jgi:hypothetical protein
MKKPNFLTWNFKTNYNNLFLFINANLIASLPIFLDQMVSSEDNFDFIEFFLLLSFVQTLFDLGQVLFLDAKHT